MKRIFLFLSVLLATLPARAQYQGQSPRPVVTVNPAGQYVAPAAGGGAATIADGADVAEGATTDAAAAAGAAGSLSAKMRRMTSQLDAISTALAALQAGLPFSPVTQAISAAALPLPAGAATAGNQSTANTSLASIDTKIPAAPATAGNQTTANASLASIDTKTPAAPATAGNQATGNTSLASIDTKSGVPRTPATGTGTPTSVSVGVSSAQAVAAATRTQRLAIQNVSATANVACSLGGTAALNTGGSFMVGPGQMLNLGDGLYIPGDAVNCIASAATTPVTVWSR